ncbi:hypothetical protein BDZ94DRAFT_474491 [Collybia nuda]|uniref:Uncharacterized protein n=1 Tax=Collybia nuda TaxID=64659 RepID=A0A9P5Y8A9_9AGAR|nr:hypothetical protein BDZ94DRAFT_474491 [Collybia nuda]
MSFSRYLGLRFASYLSFFPLLVLSLRITSPPHISTDATPATVNIEWLEDTGDPSSIGIQILCGTTSVLQHPRITATSVHDCYINDVDWKHVRYTSIRWCNTSGHRPFFLGPSISRDRYF